MFGILKLCIDTSVETYWYKVVRELISITWSFWSPIYWTLKQQSAGGDWIDVLILSNILWNEQFDFLILELYLGRETFVNTFMLQIAVLSNHLNGRDTHVRQIKVYGPRPCVFYLSVHNLLFTSFVSDYKYTDLNTPPPPLFFFFFQMLNSGTLFRISLFNLLQESSLCTPLWDEKYDLANKGEELWNCLKRRGEACS
jgi:hypothetical protein